MFSSGVVGLHVVNDVEEGHIEAIMTWMVSSRNVACDATRDHFAQGGEWLPSLHALCLSISPRLSPPAPLVMPFSTADSEKTIRLECLRLACRFHSPLVHRRLLGFASPVDSNGRPQ